MLLVAKVGAGGHAYYLEPTGVGAAPASEAPGQWVGRGAEAIGLGGSVSPGPFAAVLAGTDQFGDPLPGADRRRVQVRAYDLTFCAPKSVSLLHALSDGDVSDAVASGHRRAVGAGVEYLEECALAVRRPRDGSPRVPVRAEGAPAAAFVHRTSRALDPHLHTHVVVANVGRGPEGSWSAIDGRGLYAHAGAAGALYQAQLRHELTATLGVTWGPLAHGRADISGIGPEVRRVFSQRSQQIAAHLASRGFVPGADGPRVSRRAAQVAGLSTRAPKELEIRAEDLRPWWQGRARSAGLGPRRLEAVLDRAPTRSPGRDVGHAVDEAEVVAALATIGRAERSFTRRDVVRAWAGSLPSGADRAEVASVADRFMTGVSPLESRRGLGVAEPRVELPDRLRPRELDVLLERRGMSLEPGVSRRARHDRGREAALDTGIGFG